jgi:hypothetical protein
MPVIRWISLMAWALAGTSAWAQLVVNPFFNPPPDDFFEVIVTGSFPDPGTYSPEVTVDGSDITVDLQARCLGSCPASSPTARTFTVPPLPAGEYAMTVYLNRCCEPQSTLRQFTVGEVTFSSTQSYEGLWLAPDEPGWGLNLTHQGTILFATWFTYDRDGSGLWLSGSAPQTASATFTGTLYRTRGPAFSAMPFMPIGYADYTQVGTFTVSFTDASTGTMTYMVDGVTQTKTIARDIFSSSGVDCMLGGERGQLPNYTDLWLNSPQGSESGWGVNLVHQGDILFATWFTYRADGKDQWLVMSNLAMTGPGIYSGTIQRTTGPAFNAVPFDPRLVRRTTVGTATFTFSDADNATFVYTLDGISQYKIIVRYVFSTPTTVCQ